MAQSESGQAPSAVHVQHHPAVWFDYSNCFPSVFALAVGFFPPAENPMGERLYRLLLEAAIIFCVGINT